MAIANTANIEGFHSIEGRVTGNTKDVGIAFTYSNNAGQHLRLIDGFFLARLSVQMNRHCKTFFSKRNIVQCHPFGGLNQQKIRQISLLDEGNGLGNETYLYPFKRGN